MEIYSYLKSRFLYKIASGKIMLSYCLADIPLILSDLNYEVFISLPCPIGNF